MKHYVVLFVVVTASSAFSAPADWSQAERDTFIYGCARGIAEPAFDGYLKRHNLMQPEPNQREEAIQRAVSKGEQSWAMCSCVFDKVSNRWSPATAAMHQSEAAAFGALALDMDTGKCKSAIK